nr:MAG TPA: hypothetical protein [Caudoviricetes sp.]
MHICIFESRYFYSLILLCFYVFILLLNYSFIRSYFHDFVLKYLSLTHFVFPHKSMFI